MHGVDQCVGNEGQDAAALLLQPGLEDFGPAEYGVAQFGQ